MKTFIPSINHQKDWYVVDAENQILGRLATKIAKYLRGKHKPEYTPFLDVGDYIVVINASKIKVTGNKLQDKKYYHHTEYQGGIKEISLDKQLVKAPEFVIKHAIKGMLPKGPLGREMFKKLKVYPGADHQHQAQQPKTLTI